MAFGLVATAVFVVVFAFSQGDSGSETASPPTRTVETPTPKPKPQQPRQERPRGRAYSHTALTPLIEKQMNLIAPAFDFSGYDRDASTLCEERQRWVYHCVTLRSSGKEQYIIWDCRYDDILDGSPSLSATSLNNPNWRGTSLGDNVLYRYRGQLREVCWARNMTAAERSAFTG